MGVHQTLIKVKLFFSGIEAVKTLKAVFILEKQRSVKLQVREAQNSTSSHKELNYK